MDTAGCYAPENLKSIKDKEQAEKLILEVIFEVADYFICVVNDFTSIEIRFLNELN